MGLSVANNSPGKRVEFIYEQSERAIKQQLDALNNLRSRAGTLISTASISTSFLAAQALSDHGGLQSWGVVATTAFVAVAVCTLFVLFPRGRWLFDFSASYLLDDDKYKTMTTNELHEDLARLSERNFDHNEKRLKILFRIFGLGSLLLVIEIGAWLLRF